MITLFNSYYKTWLRAKHGLNETGSQETYSIATDTRGNI